MIDWASMFIPTSSVLEVVLRGSLMYLALFVLLRVIKARQLGGVNTADLLVIVLIADVSQNAFATETKSLTEGLLLVATILFWSFLIDWAGYRFPAVGRIVDPAEIVLIEQGELKHRNLEREKITNAELLSQLRLHGVEDPADVKLACIEPDGRISVIRQDGRRDDSPPGAVTHPD